MIALLQRVSRAAVRIGPEEVAVVLEPVQIEVFERLDDFIFWASTPAQHSRRLWRGDDQFAWLLAAIQVLEELLLAHIEFADFVIHVIQEYRAVVTSR